MTQTNLGTALQALGARDEGTDRLEQALRAYDAALEVFRSDNAPAYQQIATDNRQRVAALLEQRRGAA